MPKMKTKQAAAKRFKLTATGKVKYKRAGKRHNLGHRKRAASKLKLRGGGILNPAAQGLVKACLPFGTH